MRFFFGRSFLCIVFASTSAQAFLTALKSSATGQFSRLQAQEIASDELAIQKAKLFQLIGGKSVSDPVLADPLTKEVIQISAPGVVFGGDSRRSVQYKVQSPSNNFQGSSDTFIDLLEPVTAEDQTSSSKNENPSPFNELLKQAAPYVPVPLRQPLAALTDGEYIPMVSKIISISLEDNPMPHFCFLETIKLSHIRKREISLQAQQSLLRTKEGGARDLHKLASPALIWKLIWQWTILPLLLLDRETYQSLLL
jgi:hypothetical protein